MSIVSPHDEELRRLAEASAWRVALAEADGETAPEFEAWLADPANEAAWDEVQAGWDMLGEHAQSPELVALRRDALANVHREARRRWSAPGWRAAAAACLVVLLGFGLVWGVAWWRADKEIALATVLGERRVVTMVDGSRISLDTNSEVRVRYSDETRTIDLLRGQARFDVAHDVARPFRVQAGDRTIIATGTAFNVDLIGERVIVTLIEGSVVVLRRDGASETLSAQGRVTLRPGQQLTAAAAQPEPAIEQVSRERATAWESGTLIFEDETLDRIAERVSRYAAHPITVEPGAAALRVSGVFRAGDTATFVDTVTRYLEVRAETNADGSILLRVPS